MDRDSVPEVPTQKQESRFSSRYEDEDRRFLARSTVFLLILLLIAYLITMNIAVLATTTVIGVIAVMVFRYYFTGKGK